MLFRSKEILTEWITFREECVRRRIVYDLQRKREKLHLLEGLERILLDIDEAIRIVRETKEESEVVPNLMQGFSMDEIQAEYVAEIKLRHLNREYILRRTQEMEQQTYIAGLASGNRPSGSYESLSGDFQETSFLGRKTSGYFCKRRQCR